jgi:vancomycin resistance protein VanW
MSNSSSGKKLLSQRHPLLYFSAVWTKRFHRQLQWYTGRTKFSKNISSEKLPFRIKKHQSVLIRKLGVSDAQLQVNKVTNLKIASKKINGIIIKPGETFSFCKLVGFPSKLKGYLTGMELSNGKVKAGIGGGLCQIANLIHWLVMHSPLTVTERHHHSFDPFPDEGRVLPFGSGATVFYNYLDYQVTNKTDHTFQFNLWFSEKCLEGELRIDKELDYTYHVYEKDHDFLKINDKYYRKNEIWRDKTDKFRSGKILQTDMIAKNFAKVMYIPESFKESHIQELNEFEKAKL